MMIPDGADASAGVLIDLSRAWYDAPITEFVLESSSTIVGRLVSKCDYTVLPTQRDAWVEQIRLLQRELSGLVGSIQLEFNIPRMGRRIDAVLLIGPAVFVIEFKVGDSSFDRSAIDQVWDYCLDLKNFHEGSHPLPVVPILIATAAVDSQSIVLQADDDLVYQPLRITADKLRSVIEAGISSIEGSPVNAQAWASSAYRPTPTIVEAARALYAQHSVEAIARYDAGAENLRVTSRRIEELVDQAERNRCKVICFITGVPGAGKTLVGLNVATQRRDSNEPTHAVFLSGNGPLVAVLREALTRDEVSRQKMAGNRVRKSHVAESVKAFIQNVHHFRDDLLNDQRAPIEHVAIFDEAQRAWNADQTAKFMHRKKKRPGFSQSEPEFLISCMDRHQDWAVIICLVGGGQEINTGEAGIGTWIEAINRRFPHWHIYISSKLPSDETATSVYRKQGIASNVVLDPCLHLAVSMRSFRAENVSLFVEGLIDCDERRASDALRDVIRSYPIAVSRNLRQAKNWVVDRARGTERYGMLASSKAHRLKPDAIDIRVDVDPVHWFLSDRNDTRSSYYLEDAATEFQVQGLELDWTCVAWDADLRYHRGGWAHHRFRGDQWQKVGKADNQQYLRNAYRVLLTRARQGMVIYVPQGDRSDPTRLPAMYDSTYNYLTALGIPTI